MKRFLLHLLHRGCEKSLDKTLGTYDSDPVFLRTEGVQGLARGAWQLSDVSLLFVFAEIFNQAGATARFARYAGVAAMQDEPVMRVKQELCRDEL